MKRKVLLPIIAIVAVAIIGLLIWFCIKGNTDTMDSGNRITPVATATSEPTKDPESTGTLEPTVTPEVTESSGPTVTPEVTESPGPTVTPEVTESPGPTVTSEVTEAPEPTESPEVTEAPEPIQTPEPTPVSDTVSKQAQANYDAIAAIDPETAEKHKKDIFKIDWYDATSKQAVEQFYTHVILGDVAEVKSGDCVVLTSAGLIPEKYDVSRLLADLTGRSDVAIERVYEIESFQWEITLCPSGVIVLMLQLPEPTATPKPTTKPKPTAKPKPTVTPKPTAKPKPTVTPGPTPTPVPMSAEAKANYDAIAAIDPDIAKKYQKDIAKIDWYDVTSENAISQLALHVALGDVAEIPVGTSIVLADSDAYTIDYNVTLLNDKPAKLKKGESVCLFGTVETYWKIVEVKNGIVVLTKTNDNDTNVVLRPTDFTYENTEYLRETMSSRLFNKYIGKLQENIAFKCDGIWEESSVTYLRNSYEAIICGGRFMAASPSGYACVYTDKDSNYRGDAFGVTKEQRKNSKGDTWALKKNSGLFESLTGTYDILSAGFYYDYSRDAMFKVIDEDDIYVILELMYFAGDEEGANDPYVQFIAMINPFAAEEADVITVGGNSPKTGVNDIFSILRSGEAHMFKNLTQKEFEALYTIYTEQNTGLSWREWFYQNISAPVVEKYEGAKGYYSYLGMDEEGHAFNHAIFLGEYIKEFLAAQ